MPPIRRRISAPRKTSLYRLLIVLCISFAALVLLVFTANGRETTPVRFQTVGCWPQWTKAQSINGSVGSCSEPVTYHSETITEQTLVPIDVTFSGGSGGGYYFTSQTSGCSPKLEMTFSQPVANARFAVAHGVTERMTNSPIHYTAADNLGHVVKFSLDPDPCDCCLQCPAALHGQDFYFPYSGIQRITVTADSFTSTGYWNFAFSSGNGGSPLFVGRCTYDVEENLCQCTTAIARPQPETISGYDWTMDAEVSDRDGLVLRNVKLGDRPMAVEMSVPYYTLETSGFSTWRGELKPDSDDAVGRSRLIRYSVTTDEEKLSVLATYLIDRISSTAQSCLAVTQRYEFYKEGKGCEPTSKLPCSRFKPIVEYSFHSEAGETLQSLIVAQRNHFRVDGNPGTTVGLFRDCDRTPPPLGPGCGFNGIIFNRKANPLSIEFDDRVIENGQNTFQWDNIHQTFLSKVDEPGIEFNFPNIFDFKRPGCPECVHIHWRWGAPLGSAFGGGHPLIPFDSDQDVDFAVVRYHIGEEHPNDYRDLLKPSVESIRTWRPSGSNDLIAYDAPEDVVFWYSATGHKNQDAFFVHGGFFNPALPNAQLFASTANLTAPQFVFAVPSSAPSQDGLASITVGNLYLDGPTTVSLFDPSLAGPLPPGFSPYNNLSYDIKTDAVISSPHIVSFTAPSVTDPNVFSDLRLFHLESDPVSPKGVRWVDRTILAPSSPAPDFASRIINARSNSLGQFVLASLTQPQPPNTAEADLMVSVSDSPDPVNAGQRVTLVVAVTNNGPEQATGVRLISHIYPDTDLISAASAQGSCVEEDGTVTCSLGTVPSGASVTVEIAVTATAGGLSLPLQGKAISSDVFATAVENDSNLADNQVTTVTTVLPDSNVPPIVTITSPGNAAALTAPLDITLAANASDPDGTVDKVDFFDGGDFIGTASFVAPDQYSLAWINVGVGSHSLIAIVTDNVGKNVVSSPVNIAVNAPFAVRLTSPTNEAIFASQTQAVLAANAINTNGSISRVEFYSNGSLLGLGTATSVNEYMFLWNNMPAGSYSLAAVATNDLGETATSGSIDITVNEEPTVSVLGPTSGATFTAPTDITLNASAGDSDGYVRNVVFYANDSIVGRGNIVGAGPITGPNQYSLIWNNAPPGSYVLKAVASDSLGAITTSNSVIITINAPPTVSITSPHSGAIISAASSLDLTVSAGDSDGSIGSVDLYANASFIGSAVPSGTNQYSFNWSGIPGGSYSLTAVATDNRGASTTSIPISLTVTTFPTVSITGPTPGASSKRGRIST
jgi:uncharacterized repeat protein (TIGR01451 family)